MKNMGGRGAYSNFTKSELDKRYNHYVDIADRNETKARMYERNDFKIISKKELTPAYKAYIEAKKEMKKIEKNYKYAPKTKRGVPSF